MAQSRDPVMTGGCQCGNVRYALYSAPTSAGICHCRMCQKATGGPFAAFTGVDENDFAWTKGTPGAFRSSSLSERDFCRDCGTPLTYRFLEGTRITVTLGSLDDPGQIPVARQIGVESKLAWTDHIAEMPGLTTDEDNDPAFLDRMISFQRSSGS